MELNNIARVTHEVLVVSAVAKAVNNSQFVRRTGVRLSQVSELISSGVHITSEDVVEEGLLGHSGPIAKIIHSGDDRYRYLTTVILAKLLDGVVTEEIYLTGYIYGQMSDGMTAEDLAMLEMHVTTINIVKKGNKKVIDVTALASDIEDDGSISDSTVMDPSALLGQQLAHDYIQNQGIGGTPRTVNTTVGNSEGGTYKALSNNQVLASALNTDVNRPIAMDVITTLPNLVMAAAANSDLGSASSFIMDTLAAGWGNTKVLVFGGNNAPIMGGQNLTINGAVDTYDPMNNDDISVLSTVNGHIADKLMYIACRYALTTLMVTLAWDSFADTTFRGSGGVPAVSVAIDVLNRPIASKLIESELQSLMASMVGSGGFYSMVATCDIGINKECGIMLSIDKCEPIPFVIDPTVANLSSQVLFDTTDVDAIKNMKG